MRGIGEAGRSGASERSINACPCRIRGTSANVLVEANVIANSDVGVHVNYTTTKGGIVVRNNVEPEGVPANYNPYAAQP